MSRKCVSCGKRPKSGHSRSHSMIATKRLFMPNLQKVNILIKGKKKKAYVCTKCLKANKVQKVISS